MTNAPAIRPPIFVAIPAGTISVECRGCRVPIYFVETAKGRKMPLDVLAPGAVPPSASMPGHGTSHHASCPQAAAFRRPR